MPDEYISRKAAAKLLGYTFGVDVVRKLHEVPAADVAPVVRGRWHLLDDCANAGLYCSACGRRVHREEFAYKKLRSKYCPHCGARMDGGDGHAAD